MASNFSGSRLDALWSTREKKITVSDFEEFREALFADLRKFEEDSQKKRAVEAAHLQECCVLLHDENVEMQKDLEMILKESSDLYTRVQFLEARA